MLKQELNFPKQVKDKISLHDIMSSFKDKYSYKISVNQQEKTPYGHGYIQHILDFILDNVDAISDDLNKIKRLKVNVHQDELEEVFMDAGFEISDKPYIWLIYDEPKYNASFHISTRENRELIFHLYLSEFHITSPRISFDDIKTIIFYYNEFRKILEFEINKLKYK